MPSSSQRACQRGSNSDGSIRSISAPLPRGWRSRLISVGEVMAWPLEWPRSGRGGWTVVGSGAVSGRAASDAGDPEKREVGARTAELIDHECHEVSDVNP